MKIKIIQKIIDYIRKPRKTYSAHYVQPKSTYNKLIFTTGFGHSGSGAVLDYLAEFKDMTCLGFHDKYSGMTNGNNHTVELDFMRCIGGVLELENIFKNDIGYYNDDFALKLFKHVSEYFYRRGEFYNDRYWELTENFCNELIDFKIKVESGFTGEYMLQLKSGRKEYKNLPFNLNITRTNRDFNYIYTLKRLTVGEYRQ